MDSDTKKLEEDNAFERAGKIVAGAMVGLWAAISAARKPHEIQSVSASADGLIIDGTPIKVEDIEWIDLRRNLNNLKLLEVFVTVTRPRNELSYVEHDVEQRNLGFVQEGNSQDSVIRKLAENQKIRLIVS